VGWQNTDAARVRIRDPFAPGLDNEALAAGLEWGRCDRVRDLICEICGQHEEKIMKVHVARDHVHLFVSIPPQVTISRLLQRLKRRISHHLLAHLPHLKKQFLGATPVGKRVFLLQFRQRNRRGDRKVHPRPKHRSRRGFPSRWLNPSSIYFLKPAWCGIHPGSILPAFGRS
jgi:hypothetical protein